MRLMRAGGFFGQSLVQLSLDLAAAEFGGIRIGLDAGSLAGRLLFHAGKVDDLGHSQPLGPTMSSGRTTRSKVSPSTKPSAIASSRKVVPFLCAVLATLVALS